MDLIDETTDTIYEDYHKILEDWIYVMKVHRLNNILDKQLNRIDSITYTTTNENSQCMFCLQEYIVNEIIVYFRKCKHVYHPNCLWDWIEKKGNLHCILCNMNDSPYLSFPLHDDDAQSWFQWADTQTDIQTAVDTFPTRSHSASNCNPHHTPISLIIIAFTIPMFFLILAFSNIPRT